MNLLQFQFRQYLEILRSKSRAEGNEKVHWRTITTCNNHLKLNMSKAMSLCWTTVVCLLVCKFTKRNNKMVWFLVFAHMLSWFWQNLKKLLILKHGSFTHNLNLAAQKISTVRTTSRWTANISVCNYMTSLWSWPLTFELETIITSSKSNPFML